MTTEFRLELAALKSLSGVSISHFYRLPILIIGEQADRNQLAAKFLATCHQEDIIWISQEAPHAYRKQSKIKAVNVIGHEYRFIVYDIEGDFDPNLFAALSGTLRGGGMLLILCPPLEPWIEETKNDHWFMWRFIHKLSKSDLCIKLRLDENEFRIQDTPIKPHHTQPEHQRLEQQNLAVQQIIHVVRGHRNRPLVLLADRGRGKSAALGIAASQLLMDGLTNIFITAPSIDACAIVFKHLKLGLPSSAVFKKGNVQTSTGTLSFIAPDKLIQETPQASLLIIDEASGIPTSTLEILLKKYSRIVFASTIHGYEGSGYCFPIAFFNRLDKLAPGWKKTILTHPIRWAESDPLETLTNQLFLLTPLKKRQIENHQTELPNTQLHIQQVSAEELAKNETLISQLYELLSTAHYKTQPSDLLHILNEPKIRIFLMLAKEKIIAAAFTMSEGGLDSNIGKAIYLGDRRPKGNIIPQTLAMHIGIESATQLNYLRIMRIAVQPDLQNKSLGSKLAKYLVSFAEKHNYNATGCSFSSTDRLIHFWGKLDFSIVRLGYHRKANSNGYASLMLKATDNPGKQLLLAAKAHFNRNFHYQLKETHRDLGYSIIISILKNVSCQRGVSLNEKDKRDIELYTQGNRQYEDNMAVIHRFVQQAFAHENTFKQLDRPQLAILVVKVLQQRNWQDTTSILCLGGKNNTALALKKAISKLMVNENLLND